MRCVSKGRAVVGMLPTRSLSLDLRASAYVPQSRDFRLRQTSAFTKLRRDESARQVGEVRPVP